MTDPIPESADDAFAHRLFNPLFVDQVLTASAPMFPALLNADQEDITKDALLKAYAARAKFKGTDDEDLLKWVLVILRNHVRDVLRGQEGLPETRELPEEAEEIFEARPVPDGVVEEETALPSPAQAWLEMAKGILNLLSPEDRDVLLLRYGHSLTMKETAEFLSKGGPPVTEGAVKVRVHRAFLRLTELAARHGLTPRSRPRGRPTKGGEDPRPRIDEN